MKIESCSKCGSPVFTIVGLRSRTGMVMRTGGTSCLNSKCESHTPLGQAMACATCPACKNVGVLNFTDKTGEIAEDPTHYFCIMCETKGRIV